MSYTAQEMELVKAAAELGVSNYEAWSKFKVAFGHGVEHTRDELLRASAENFQRVQGAAVMLKRLSELFEDCFKEAGNYRKRQENGRS